MLHAARLSHTPDPAPQADPDLDCLIRTELTTLIRRSPRFYSTC
jgi:hypothetical protein